MYFFKKNLNLIIFLLLILIFNSCSFFQETFEEPDYNSQVTALSLSSKTININFGENDYLSLIVNPSDIQSKINVEWIYDTSILYVESDNYGAVITGLKNGTTYIKAKCNGIIATTLVSITGGDDEYQKDPYIYSGDSVLQLKPGDIYTVTASLYGGTITDMEEFTFSIKDSSVANISYSRNNCIVKALKNGSTQLVAHHPKTKYEYTFIVFVSTDTFDVPFITTTNNIVSINSLTTKSADISVDLMNPPEPLYQSGFTWEYVDDSSEYFSFDANSNYATITAKKSGIGKIRVKHTNAQYPLDIIVRISTIVENVFISTNVSNLIITGSDNTYTINSSISGYKGYADVEAFEYTFEDTDGNPFDPSSICDINISGENLNIKGKKNGSFRIIITHPLSAIRKKVLVILREQIGSAIDPSVYITTTDNYKETKVGNDTFTVNVSLVGGLPGDENDFIWKIENGSNNEYCSITTTTGHIENASRSAATSGQYAYANLQITPKKAGEVKIYVSHPKCMYETEIMIKVYSQYALLSNPVTIVGIPSTLKLLNGASETLTASLLNADAGEENNINWNSSINDFTVSPSVSSSTLITASGSGTYSGYITVSHSSAIAEKRILVMSAATQEALDNFKAIFAENTYYRLNENKSIELQVDKIGYSDDYNFSQVSWTVDDSSICIPVKNSSNPLKATVNGLKAGITKVKCSFENCEPVVFDITVVPEGESTDVIEAPAYMTTTLNAFVLENIGDTQNLSVTGVNISELDMTKTVWELDQDAKEAFTITSNGKNASVTSKKTGKGNIKVRNNASKNELTVMAKCGELYEWDDDYLIYIVSESDVYNVVKGKEITIGVALENFSTGTNPGFNWSIKTGSQLAEITGTREGTCVINAKEAGQMVLEVSNTLAVDTKEILINISNTEEELKGFRYLTTKQNVIIVGQGNNCSVVINMENAETPILSGYNWITSNSNICTVVQSGLTAVVYGHECGTAKITVSNPSYCDYPLEIIVNVVDPILASANPYITSPSIVTCTVGSSAQTIIAELIGGKESDKNNFSWSVVDSGIVALYSSNEQAQVTALKEGVTQVIISHPKSTATRTVLIICEPKSTVDYYISLSDSILKLSPSESERIITAQLVNGTANDAYDFVWWADSYDIINMNYTGGTCVIEPISSGKVTIHVKHPKAPYQKDIYCYISQYTQFAFAQSYIELNAGTSQFVMLQVPVTGTDCKVSYKVNNSSVAQVMNSTDDMALIKGISEGSTTITAELLSVTSGIVQSTAQLLVSVTKGDNNVPVINYNGSTVLTLTKGTSNTLTAGITGTDVSDKNLLWKSSDSSILSLYNCDTAGRVSGKDCKINAVKSGNCTLTISYSDQTRGIQTITIYIIVPGESDTVILLNHSAIELVENNDAITLSATVKNAKEGDDNIEWSCDDETVAYFKGSGKTISILPNKIGKCTITATTPTSHKIATCEITVTEAPFAQFYILKEGGVKEKITSLQLSPLADAAHKKVIYYEVKPADQKVTYSLQSQSYCFVKHDAESKTFEITPTSVQGTTTLTINAGGIKESITLKNSWNYQLKLDKSVINTSPDTAETDKVWAVNYTVSPADARIKVSGFAQNYDRLKLKSGIYNSSYSNYSSGNTYYVITEHSNVDIATNTATGTIWFTALKECYADNLSVDAINPNANNETFGSKQLSVISNFPRHNIGIRTINSGSHCRYSADKNELVVGDGESIKIIPYLNESSKAYVNTFSASFEGNGNAYGGLRVEPNGDAITYGSSNSTPTVTVSSPLDFGVNGYYWDSQAGTKKPKVEITPQSILTNDAIQVFAFVGSIVMKFKNVNGNEEKYSIPVYIEIRNTPAN